MNIRHVPNSKDAVSPRLLRIVIAHLPRGPLYLQMKLAIVIMYMSFIRQSSLAPPTVAQFDTTRHLTHGDLSLSPKGLHIHIKWSKTLQKTADAKTLLLPPTKDKTLCPVIAYREYIASLPTTPSPLAPLMAFEDGNAMTVRALNRIWAQALRSADLSPTNFSLHSLRRGGASYTYNDQKADLNDVMTQGTWRSSAVRAYIKPKDNEYNTVHEALMRL